jgi:hypothetical protein
MKKFIHLIALTALAVGGARAGIITITLDDPNQFGIPGETLNFFGTITNTDTTLGDQPVFLNSDSLNFTLTDATVVDNFYTNVPLDLAEGESSGDIDLFDITLANPETNPFGKYSGSYVLLGGMDGGADTASDNLAQVDFTVTATPEPATFVLLGIGLAFISRLQRPKRSAGTAI